MNPANDNSFFTTQRLMKIGVAIIFDFVKFLFSILFLLAPLIACVASAAVVSSYIGGGTWLQGAACAAGGLLTGVFEAFTGGAGIAAIQAVGEVLADALDFAAWIFFSIWFMMSGTKFLGGGKRSTARFISAAGSAIIGAVPFLNVLPTITIGVVAVEWNQWKADQEKAAASVDSGSSARAAQLAAQREAMEAAYEQRAAAEYAAQMQAAANEEEALEEAA